ncbi:MULTISPECIES: YueI family protein [Enterococcus]|uniref:DUF1694 domain-containing protein n=1 Tax=Enterococcus sulfureus ATCC 49903 TaxID=1140003 RepID=S0PCF3_9ENTE|nr:YueI family protein [Enterococcus sulfureus]EOT46359.1 hypothetical protein OMY_01506 [Enterococcus sulfureus ATCC 49903]EOT86328.1 hypothetical protein I573_01083 [Enterococcus sulfureus ATCC 49903]
MADELQKHLDSGRYGSPKLHPDEQRAYLGTFRERCYLKMTIDQMKEKNWTTVFFDHIADYQDASCLINDQVPQNIQALYIQKLSAAHIPFRIVSYEGEITEDTAGLLVVTDHAVDEPNIEIETKYQLPEEKKQPVEKKSFWKKWF